MKQGKLLILGRKVNSHRGLGPLWQGFFTLLCAAFLVTSAQAASYRWSGDDGQVIYSQVPPHDGRPYTVIGAPPPPADQAKEQAQLNALRQSQADAAEDKELAAKAQAEAAARQALIDRNCEIARGNIVALQGSLRRLIRQPDGSVRRLTPEEHDAKLAEARAYLTENCR